MIIVIDPKQEEVPDFVLEQKRDRMVVKGFVFMQLLGGYLETAEPAFIGRHTWYVDVSQHPACTAGDINDLCEAVFPPSPSGTIRKARWSYIPTTGIVSIEQVWRI
jgi:hypothetical protein